MQQMQFSSCAIPYDTKKLSEHVGVWPELQS